MVKKNPTITSINDIFTDEDADDENLDIWLTNNSDIYLNSFSYNRLGIGTTNPKKLYMLKAMLLYHLI